MVSDRWVLGSNTLTVPPRPEAFASPVRATATGRKSKTTSALAAEIKAQVAESMDEAAKKRDEDEAAALRLLDSQQFASLNWDPLAPRGAGSGLLKSTALETYLRLKAEKQKEDEVLSVDTPPHILLGRIRQMEEKMAIYPLEIMKLQMEVKHQKELLLIAGKNGFLMKAEQNPVDDQQYLQHLLRKQLKLHEHSLGRPLEQEEKQALVVRLINHVQQERKKAELARRGFIGGALEQGEYAGEDDYGYDDEAGLGQDDAYDNAALDYGASSVQLGGVGVNRIPGLNKSYAV